MEAVNFVKKNNSKLHIAGLLTSGSVHAYFNHILTLLELANKNNISQIKLHLFTDGKDSGLKEGRQLLIKLDGYLKNYPNVKIATLIGRDFAMDRNDNWDLTEKAYNLMTQGQGDKTDNLIQKLGENYAVIFFNFREDSMRQIIKSFVEEDIIDFERKAINNLLVVGMTEYIKKPNLLVAFPIPEIKNGLSEVLSINNKKQLHIAETDKYAHVTYFFNCLQNEPLDGETDIFIKSTRKPDQNPEMMANEILEKVLEELKRDFYDFMVINLANADLVAHSGNLEKTTQGEI